MDILFHLFVPLAVLALMRPGIGRRETAYLLCLSVLPDLDRFFGLRKYMFHNVAFVVLLSLAIYLYTREKRFSLLCGFVLFSHLLLDMGSEMAILYPFSSTFYKVHASLNLENYMPVFHFYIERATSVEQGVGTIVSPSGFGLLAVVAIALALKRRK